MILPEINLTAILVASVISMILGMLWYSLIFGTIWKKYMEISKEDTEKQKKKGMKKLYLLNFCSIVLMAFVLAHFIVYMQITSLRDGVFLGMLVWAGFVATSNLNPVLWEKHKVSLYLISMGYFFVSLCIMGAILVQWQ